MRPIALLVLFASFVVAETRPNDAALIKEAKLLSSPGVGSVPLGVLPEGSIVEVVGPRESGYLEIRVELEDGQYVRGWVEEQLVGGVPTERIARPDPTRPGPGPKPKGKSKILIPMDEAVLLRRDPTFFYGIYGGGNYSFLQSPSVDYQDFGGQLGLEGGFFLYPFFPLRFELGYDFVQGASPNGTFVTAGLVDAGLIGAYRFDPFEVSLGLRYLYGASVSAVPTDIQLPGGAPDLSSAYLTAGVGGHLRLSTVSSIGLRLGYYYSMVQKPLAQQFFLANLFVDVTG